MNQTLAKKILENLAQKGIYEIILCSGARNSPFVALLENSEGFTVYSFFEERSAAFFALGRIKDSGRPVAVLTTSGTASAELFPAVIEAHYTSLPIVLITADRPRKLRGTGSPQTIDQVNLFGRHTELFFDLAVTDHFNLEGWTGRGPLHINVCFDEPLIEGEIKKVEFSPQDVLFDLIFSNQTIAEHYIQLKNFLENTMRPLALIGPLTPTERQSVKKFLLAQKFLVFAESLSGLREDPELQEFMIRSGEAGLGKLNFDSILRVGGVPTLRLWRDIENNIKRTPVLSISSQPFSGLSHGKLLHTDLNRLFKSYEIRHRFEPEYVEQFIDYDRRCYKELMSIVDSEPTSEVGMVQRLSYLVEPDAKIYLGNSLPIREWDMIASRDRNSSWELAGNRGVNGIDGQISTFLGFASNERPNWGIFGDLTSMYDLTSPWALKQRCPNNVRIVIINNSGGQIFSRIFKSQNFLNSHDLEFSHWAKMWNLSYERWSGIPQHFRSEEATVIEVCPDREATSRFWKKYEELFLSSSCS